MKRKMMGKGKAVSQPIAGKPSAPVFGKTAKKSERDDRPAPMGGGKQPGGLAKNRMKRLKGLSI